MDLRVVAWSFLRRVARIVIFEITIKGLSGAGSEVSGHAYVCSTRAFQSSWIMRTLPSYVLNLMEIYVPDFMYSQI